MPRIALSLLIINKQISYTIGNVRWINQESFPKTSLNPYYVSGLVDAEGCFTWKTYENNAYKAGWGTQPLFHIVLHSRDKELLEKIQNFFLEV